MRPPETSCPSTNTSRLLPCPLRVAVARVIEYSSPAVRPTTVCESEPTRWMKAARAPSAMPAPAMKGPDASLMPWSGPVVSQLLMEP